MDRKIADMKDDEVILEVGEGYVTISMTVEMLNDLKKLFKVLRTMTMTPEYAREVGAKLIKYADMAAAIAPVPKVD